MRPSFIIETKDPASVIEKARAGIIKAGGQFGRDFFKLTIKKRFFGDMDFEGRWKLADDGIEITMTKAPYFITDDTLQDKVKAYFATA